MIETENDFLVAKRFIPPRYCNRLMFMGIKGENVYMYKHIDTRRYIYIDTQGIFFLYDNGVLIETTQDKAIEHLLS
jgi:hypothetical protein